MEEKVKNTGILSMVMLPARNNTFFTEDKRYYTITIPRKGKYTDIDLDFFSEEDGEFDILNDKNILFLPAITKVLFASKQYPDLADNQLFVPLTLTFREECVDIVGQVIELIPDKEK
jgi:hypothetical protein